MICFHSENISLWNIMTGQKEQKNNPDRMHEFVQHLVEAMPKFTGPLPEAFAQLLNDLDELPPQKKPRNIANPIAFIRMSNILHRNISPTMGEMSQSLALPFPTVTRIVDWFVENGYAQRLPDASDRRIVRVAHTEKGSRLHEAIENHIAQSIHKIIGCLTDKEQATLLTLLRKIASASSDDVEHG
jgi:DNA-binding MarR family transcriptional regulator